MELVVRRGLLCPHWSPAHPHPPPVGDVSVNGRWRGAEESRGGWRLRVAGQGCCAGMRNRNCLEGCCSSFLSPGSLLHLLLHKTSPGEGHCAVCDLETTRDASSCVTKGKGVVRLQGDRLWPCPELLSCIPRGDTLGQ
ncbi:hypothetical protein INR49_018659, partial [Caranx melampygus]